MEYISIAHVSILILQILKLRIICIFLLFKLLFLCNKMDSDQHLLIRSLI